MGVYCVLWHGWVDEERRVVFLLKYGHGNHLNKYILSICCVSGIRLGTGRPTAKGQTSSLPLSLRSSWTGEGWRQRHRKLLCVLIGAMADSRVH